MVTVWIALGSNLGDRRAHLDWACGELRKTLVGLRSSTFIETAAVGVPDLQPDYLNAVVTGATALGPFELLGVLRDIERRRGRERRSFRAARTLDVDLVFYGDQRINTPELVVPHPRFRERRFVLQPLAELDPAWLDPVTGKTVGILLAELPVQTTGA